MVVLEKRLLYLTYLSVFGYRVVEDGGVIEINDEEIIRLAKSYGVAPLLVLTTLSTRGEEDIKAAYTILNSEELMDNLITNLLEIIKRKGYYGINITYQLLSNETLSSYEYFTSKIYERLRSEGYFVVVTISPNQIITESGITFERVDYTKIIPLTDLIIILNYNWGYSLSFPAPVSSIDKTNDFLDNIIPYAPPSKIAIGQPLIGYDWQLPYTIGLTKANSLTVNDVYILANQVGATIEYNPLSQTPFFTYNESTSGIPINHIVWFIDSRSFDALLKLITDRGLNGCGIWNIFNYYPQFWVVINVQYDIENVLESTL
jgi:spore germination protein